ncbi:DUF2232 domain-containing protein [uncultured Gemella sp.]|uniref:DUF2232 domain-containing protein n=1 Tax=uncultured Gemella sp. TaxID=254352 RepID=UPI0028E836D1|nr:DUF2232 domain-containing protein [uncultured Gemella sp.]
MDNNISDLLTKEIAKAMLNRFFFKEPSNLKIFAYSVGYILLILLGTLLNIEIVAAFLSVFPLTYVLGAKGLKLYLPLIASGGIILALLGSPIMMFWFGIHMAVAYIIYKTIDLRFSKLFLVVAIATVLFLGIAIYVFLSIRLGNITIDSKQILEFINNYVNSMVEMNQNVDKNLVLESFSSMQRTFPVTLYIMLFVYSLAIVQYTLSLLAREYVIIPAFPKFSRITLSSKSGYIYIGVSLITLLFEMELDENKYSFWNILFQNISGVLALAFILNGLFTAYFFIEQKTKNKVTIAKPITFVLMLIFSPIFELLGFIDSIFKLREGYIIMKKGE